MRILYIITKSNWGGAQRHVYDLATSMKERGHEVIVALGGEGILRQKLESAGIYTHTIPDLMRDVSFKNDFRSLREIMKIIRHRKPEIVHLHSPKASGLGSLASRLLRVNLVIQTIHGWTFNENRPLLEKAGIMFFSWITILLTHKTILLSNREYEQGRQFPGTKHKLVLIPPGIRPHILMSIDGAKLIMSRTLNMPDFSKKTAIAVIAELHPNKGLSYLLTAIQSIITHFPNVICVIIGEGEEREKLTKTISELGLSGNVFMPGYIENAAEYLKAFSLLVLPSLKEGLPYVLLEAGIASIPVVATTVGGIPEIVEDMKSGILVQIKNHKELAHAISFMIEHPGERKKYGAALREKTLQSYSLENMVSNIEELYLGTKKPRSDSAFISDQ